MTVFLPLFKEKEGQQFYYLDGLWYESNEHIINMLWQSWVNDDKAEKQSDENGFIVYGYKIEINKNQDHE